MEICGEHGEEIAYMGRECPACEQIEDLNREFHETIHDLEQDLSDADNRIDELEQELEDKK